MTPRIHDRLTVAAFLAALVLPALCRFAGWDLPSSIEDEKRTPAAFPAWPATRAAVEKFPRGVDTWFQDHFGLRQLLIRSHAALLYRGLHTAPQPKVILGRDGWIFYDGAQGHDGDPVADARGTDPISPFALEQWRWMLADLQDWFAARGVPFAVAFVPAKELIYPEALPGWMKPVANAAAIDDLCRHLRGRSTVPVLNLRPVLEAAKAEGRLYRRTDTHWNDLGAYHGYGAILEQAARLEPRLRPLPREAFQLERQWGYGGDLAGMASLRRIVAEEHYTFVPVQPRRATVRVLGGYEQADAESSHPDASLPRAFLLRDSFTESLIPYLAEHFSTAYYHWPPGMIDYTALCHTNVDLALAILGDRHLRQPFRYPARVQEEQTRARFAKAAPGLRLDPAALARGARGDGLSAELTPDGLLLRTGRAGETWLELPAVEGVRTRLPLVAIELTLRKAGDVQLQWGSGRTPDAGYTSAHRVAVPAAAGRSTICLPLLDPQMTGPVRFTFARPAGPAVLHGIEIRTVPR